jgi:hypothetical protein
MQGAARQDLEIHLDAPSNLLIELQFDFSDVVLRLSLVTSSHQYITGQLSSTGSSLFATGLDPGRHVLSIFESTVLSAPELLRCRPLTFRVMVERDESKARTSRGLLNVPETLDDIGYLKYDGTLHFAHEFDLENVNLMDSSKISEYTNVSVTSDSLMSVHMRMLYEDEEDELVPSFSILDLTAPALSQSGLVGRPQLAMDYLLVSGHQYRLGWSARAMILEGLSQTRDVQMFVEISIVPLTVLTNQVSMNAASYGAPACAQARLTLPTIDVSSDSFMFARDNMAFSTSQAKVSTSFNVSDELVLYAGLEYQFALTPHLNLMLESVSNGTDTVRVLARSDRNRRWLHEVLGPGLYTLSLYPEQLAGSPAARNVPHCNVASLHVAIRPAWQGVTTHIADCTALNLLPRNLSNAAPFGQPINSATGELVVFGERFLYPERSAGHNDLSHSFSQLTLPSLKSLQFLVFFEVDQGFLSRGSAAVEFGLLVFNKMMVPGDVRAYADQTSTVSRLSRYRVQEASAAVVQLGFRHNADESVAGTCPYYTFASYALNSDLLSSNLLCTSKQQNALTNKPPAVASEFTVKGTYYNHSNGFVSSLWQSQTLFAISISVNRTSILHYSASSNAFGSDMTVRLKRNGVERRVGSSTVMPTYQDHYMNTRVFGNEYLMAGDYVLSFQHTSITNDAGLTNARGQTLSGAGFCFFSCFLGFLFWFLCLFGFVFAFFFSFFPQKGLCLPWSTDIWVAPLTGYVFGVAPAKLWTHRPNVPLSLQLSFSDRVRVKETMEAATVRDILATFYLKPEGGGSELLPVSGTLGGAGTGLRLVWGPGSMSLGVSYKLQMRPFRLVTSAGAPLELMSEHSYRVIPANYCGANGRFNADYLCVCSEGFGGSDCSTCGVGYVAKQGSSPLQCIKTLRPVCQPCSCGCDSDNQPLGVCDDSGGSFVCTCSPS